METDTTQEKNALEKTTRHGYDTSEIPSVQRWGMSHNDAQTACFAAAERDLSGCGNAAWKTLFEQYFSDSVMSSPLSIIQLFQLFDKWNKSLEANSDKNDKSSQSHRDADCRVALMTAVYVMSSLPKNRYVADACVVTLKEDLEELKNCIQEDSAKEYATLMQGMKPSCDWMDRLAGVKPEVASTDEGAKRGRRRKGGEMDRMLDVHKLVEYFVMLLHQTSLRTEQKEKDAAAVLEKNLLVVTQMLLSVHTLEKRTVVPTSKGNHYLRDFFAALPKKRDRLQSLCSKVAAQDSAFFNTVVGRIFLMLLHYLKSFEKNANMRKNVMCCLFVYMEYTMDQLLDKKGAKKDTLTHAVVGAVLLVAKRYAIDCQSYPKKDMADNLASFLAYYETYPVDEPLQSERVAARRTLTIEKQYLDRHAERIRGRDTRPQLDKYLEKKGLSFTEEECAKSHGPRFELFPKQTDGLPTVMSHHLDVVGTFGMYEDRYYSENPYSDPARKLLLDMEEALAKKSKNGVPNLDKLCIPVIAEGCYPQWTEVFGVGLVVAEATTSTKRKATTDSSQNAEEETVELYLHRGRNVVGHCTFTEDSECFAAIRAYFSANATDDSEVKAPSRKRRAIEPKDPVQKRTITAAAKRKPTFDIISAVEYEPLPENALVDTVIVQKTNGKKFVRASEEMLYRGPFATDQEKDVGKVQTLLWRMHVMKQWGNELTPDQKIYYDAPNNGLYFCMHNIGETVRADWKVEKKEIKGYTDACEIAEKESIGLQQVSKYVTNENFGAVMPMVVRNLAYKYLLGISDGSLNNIYMSTGAKSMLDYDLEDSRENLPLCGTEEAMNYEERFLDCLFGKKRPSVKACRRFCLLLSSMDETMERIYQTVEQCDYDQLLAYANKIEYKNAPTRAQLAERVDSLRRGYEGLKVAIANPCDIMEDEPVQV